MTFSLHRVILFVKDVELLKGFYQKHFQFELLEQVTDEWVVLRAGSCELALHKSGKTGEGHDGDTEETNNVKLVLETSSDLRALREELVRDKVSVKEITSFPGFPGLFCDGRDPEGNVFQLSQRSA